MVSSPVAEQDTVIPHGLPQPPRDLWIAPSLTIALLMFITWRNIAVGIVFPLAGRAWMTTIAGGLYQAMFAVGALIAYLGWCYPERLPKIGGVIHVLIWIAAGFKLVLIPVVARILRQTNITSKPTLGRMLMFWLTGCALMWGTGYALRLDVMILAPLAVLIVPFNRIGLSFLALRWNRHR